jgi:hypothetical protein
MADLRTDLLKKLVLIEQSVGLMLLLGRRAKVDVYLKRESKNLWTDEEIAEITLKLQNEILPEVEAVFARIVPNCIVDLYIDEIEESFYEWILSGPEKSEYQAVNLFFSDERVQRMLESLRDSTSDQVRSALRRTYLSNCS